LLFSVGFGIRIRVASLRYAKLFQERVFSVNFQIKDFPLRLKPSVFAPKPSGKS